MATLRPPPPHGSSTSSGKRRKLQGELKSRDSEINSKQQQLKEAQEALSGIMKRIVTWEDVIARCALTINDSLKDAVERAEAKAERAEAKAERAEAKATCAKAEAVVQRLTNELEELQEQWKTTKQQVSELVPDASEYFRAAVRLGAPSDLTSHDRWWKAQRSGSGINPLFLCFVPPEARPEMPVELAEQVFSRFLEDARKVVVDQHDCEFTHKLCLLVGRELKDENEMATEFRKLVSDYLGDDFAFMAAFITCPQTPSSFPTDGCVFILKHMALLAELKLHPKTALFQAMQYYLLHVASLSEKKMQQSFLPCFLIELVGTCIRISGLVYSGKVACQPLTPFLHCYINLFDRSDMNTLCRAMHALRNGIHTLHKQYSAEVSADVTRNKNIPHHLCLPGVEFQKRIADKLMFVMKVLESGELKVVKFCRRYGVSVHKAWAQHGLAPKLIKDSKGEDGWYAIEMEYLDPDKWKSVHEWSKTSQTSTSRSQLKAAISSALDRAHQISVDGSKSVHGDLRSPNIMVREDSLDVKFIDFDWSGIDGQTRYPSFMNMDLDWHRDVGPGKPLRQEHDTKWLDALIEH